VTAPKRPPSESGSPSKQPWLRPRSVQAILAALRSDGPASVLQLANRTHLSKAVVDAALQTLERAGLVRPAGDTAQGRNPSATLFEHDPTAGYVVGVDVGQSWVRCAVADLAGDIVGRRDIRNTSRTVPSLVTSVSRLAHQVVEDAGIPWSRVAQTVVGSPGVFDPGDGTLLLASRIRRWGRPGLLDALRDELGERTAVANDANLAAIGERWFGCGVGVGTFVYLLVGTGVGMGIVIDGKLHLGARGAAGEVAYLPFGDETLSAANGHGSRWGSFEEVASAQGVIQDAVELGMSPRLSARRIFDAARRGDVAARGAVDREGERLAVVIAAISALIDPELVVLGGGIGSNLELLRAPLVQRLHQLTPFRPRIVASELGDEAILLGAVASALEAARDRVFELRLAVSD
jgi:predicted NBD/HSP70 family sugar kinase